jgi:hypothetical protein
MEITRPEFAAYGQRARGVTAAKGKTAYLIDPAGGRILKMTRK